MSWMIPLSADVLGVSFEHKAWLYLMESFSNVPWSALTAARVGKSQRECPQRQLSSQLKIEGGSPGQAGMVMSVMLAIRC